MSGRPAIFFDRDGTLIEEVQYLIDAANIRLVDSAVEAMKMVNESGSLCVVVTNQSAVARGQLHESELKRINDEISHRFSKQGARIDTVFCCPHHPSIGVDPYVVDCTCRKPKPGLLLEAAAALEIDLERSVLIGDSLRDIEAGHRGGCLSVLVLTGNGSDEVLNLEQGVPKLEEPDYIGSDILRAVIWALERISE